jgi:hypothetical protein
VGAYLLFGGISKNSDEAIVTCRAGRKKMFHKKYNQDYLRSFEKYLREIRQLYPYLGQKESLRDILKKQRIILQGKDS